MNSRLGSCVWLVKTYTYVGKKYRLWCRYLFLLRLSRKAWVLYRYFQDGREQGT